MPFDYPLAAAAVVIAAAVVAPVAVVVAAAAAEQQNQNDDPPAVIATKTVTTHKKYLQEFFRALHRSFHGIPDAKKGAAVITVFPEAYSFVLTALSEHLPEQSWRRSFHP